MILPIVAYGDPVLRKLGKDIDKDHPGLADLVANMWETMYQANGVGLAAPQIGKPIRMFLIDTTPFADDEELSEKEQKALNGFKKVFINVHMVEEFGRRGAEYLGDNAGVVHGQFLGTVAPVLWRDHLAAPEKAADAF